MDGKLVQCPTKCVAVRSNCTATRQGRSWGSRLPGAAGDRWDVVYLREVGPEGSRALMQRTGKNISWGGVRTQS